MTQFQVAPSPWKLKGRTWIFALSGLSRNQSFPAGFAEPSEAEALSAGGTFVGGQGSVQLVSYTESPVGPYDELIYVPGRWKYSDGSTSFRVTRIFVSTKTSTFNGRRNWNIPKHLAEFNYKTGSDGVSHLSVSLPGSPTPFFRATVSPITLVSSIGIPFSSTILGKFYSLIQPPLPAVDAPEEVGTTEWAETIPTMKGNVYVASVSSGIDGKLGDGVSFPAVTPYSIAVCMDQVDLEFPAATFAKTR